MDTKDNRGFAEYEYKELVEMVEFSHQMDRKI